MKISRCLLFVLGGLLLGNAFPQKAGNQSKWFRVQEDAKDTVVQLFVYTSAFNWRVPYKTPRQSRQWGTGWFIDSDGYIVSNYHVVDDAVSVKVQIPSLGKERFEAVVVGSCPDRDVALLKLSDAAYADINDRLRGIRFLEYGDSDRIVRTQEVLALGYPLGQQRLKSTEGIVSGRENVDHEPYIQVTAAINAGSSGGPVLNKDGKVIGISTASISGAQNVGYIIPINDVKAVIDDLRQTVFLRKPFFGAKFNNASRDMVEYFDNPSTGGYYIAQVYPETLFAKAGIQEGDMLYAINGYTFDHYGETNVPWADDKIRLSSLLNRFRLGEKITVEFYRRGKKKEATIVFDLLEPLPIRRFYPKYEKVDYEVLGGMVVMPLTINHLRFFYRKNRKLLSYKRRENQYKSRLLITHILHESQVRKARVLRPGNILEEVNGEKVFTLDDFRKAVLNTDKFISFKAEDKRFMVLSAAKVLGDEDRLSKRNFYKKSDLVRQLEKRLVKRKNRGKGD